MTDDQRILRDFTLHKVLPVLRPTGTYIVPDPSPLTSEQIEEALIEVCAHENWEGQTVQVPNEDGVLTTLSGFPGAAEVVTHD